MFIIGVTGGTGAGKTTALKALKSLGSLVLDCDEVYHELLIDDAELKSELEARFSGVLKGGAIDRKQLSEIVWNDPSALLDLNEITHKYVNAAIKQKIAQWEAQGGKIAAIDAIAIFESGIREICNVIVVVTAPVETRLLRIMKRDGLTREQALSRINAQKSSEYFKKNSDHVLEGIYETPEEFEKVCKDFFADLLEGEENA